MAYARRGSTFAGMKDLVIVIPGASAGIGAALAACYAAADMGQAETQPPFGTLPK